MTDNYRHKMDEKQDPALGPFKHLFSLYRALILTDVSKYISQEVPLVFPAVPQSLMEAICDRVTQHFRKESVVLNLPHDIVIVGDIHGHILDLFRILARFGFPPEQRYLFLGDIVDRGEFSTETITLVYLMKALWPDDVFLLRGNHEFLCRALWDLREWVARVDVPLRVFVDAARRCDQRHDLVHPRWNWAGVQVAGAAQ